MDALMDVTMDAIQQDVKEIKKEYATAADAVISMQNINKSYMVGSQPLRVLKDVSLTVKKGEYLAILGPSGS